MYENQNLGQLSEFYVMYRLAEQGWEVTCPSGNPRWDALICRESERYFVQIKGTVRKGDTIVVDLRGSGDTRYYTAEEIDIIAIHDREDNAVYYVPIAEAAGKSTFTLRLTPLDVPRRGWSRVAADYTSLENAIAKNKARNRENSREAAVV